MRGYEILLLGMLAVAAVCYAPGAVTDLNSLILEESLTVTCKNGEISIEGGKLSGNGKNWQEAMHRVYETAAGTVFLETTDRILIAKDAAECIPEILQDTRLRPGTQLYIFKGEPGDSLTEFAAAHESDATIAKCNHVPILIETEGGYCFEASA